MAPGPNFHNLSVDFLRTEIETGSTFAELAAGAGDDRDKRERNRGNAKQALATVERFLPKALGVTPDERNDIEAELENLRIAIAAIPA
jgi:hypothetical protein